MALLVPLELRHPRSQNWAHDITNHETEEMNKYLWKVSKGEESFSDSFSVGAWEIVLEKGQG